MKKSIFVAGFAAVLVLGASAQITQKEEPPKPPAPPKPAVSKMKDVPPPPPPPPPSEPPVPASPAEGGFWMGDEYDAFLKRNASVKSLQWNSKNELIVRLKSGKEEKYNLEDEKSRKAAEEKYGGIPVAPPPPPPAPEPPAKKGKRTLS